MDYLAIIAVVERGKAQGLVEKAKEAGLLGGTILYGRGTGVFEAPKLLNLHIESSKEVILIVSPRDAYRPIYDVLVEAGKFHEPGKGIIFTLPADNVLGLSEPAGREKHK
ncbi:MAG: P-II family nitrogen regulator [Firmicutes bacterium]|jgi:nitrogen regulatory protein PII|nr:P-II family nitrogen regulator [Bacillota bacterium]